MKKIHDHDPGAPRIALIHALAESMQPAHAAFERQWPEAVLFDLLDTSLARDLALAGRIEPRMIERFLALGRYAAGAAGEGGRTAAILFTCSAFQPAIDAVKQALDMPVLRPNEAAFDQALMLGGRVGLLVTFPPSLPALETELRQMARERGVEISITGQVVEGALDALRTGDARRHDELVAMAAARMPMTESLVLGQFSLARAAAAIAPRQGRTLLITPLSAVDKLRAQLHRAYRLEVAAPDLDGALGSSK